MRTPVDALITFPNIYVYSAFKLWIAYGIAILSTMIASLIGLIAIISSGASFSNNFSSVMRSAWNAELNVDVRLEDANSRDPLPEYLAMLLSKC